MSISSMASHAVARRFPESQEAQIVKVKSQSVNSAGQKTPQDKFTQALEVVMAYVPTEILTLYVATIAAIQGNSEKTAAQTGQAGPGSWVAFTVFLAATPLVVWLIYAAKFKARENGLPWSLQDWPKWEMISATVAYLAWAYALPNTPFLAFDWYSVSVAAIIVMATAALLGLLTPLFHPEHS